MADNEPTTPPQVRRSMTTPPPAPRKIRPINETDTIVNTPLRSRRRLFAVSESHPNDTILDIPEFTVLVFRREKKQIGKRHKNH